MKARIYLVRHGETEKNKERLLQGRSNLPLNETGIRQAEEAGRYFRERGITFDRIYSSPLLRAVQTARIIAGEDTELIPDDRLLEMDYGPWEGTSLLNPAPEIVYFFQDFVHHPAPEGMESLASVVERLRDFLGFVREELAGPGAPERGEAGKPVNILISTHAIAMKGALEALTPEAGGYYWSKFIANCGVYGTELTDTGFSLPVEVIESKR